MTVQKYTLQDFRRSLRDTTKHGIATAEFYVKQLAGQYGNEQAAAMYCNGRSVKWSTALKQARSEFTYHAKGMGPLPLDDMAIDQSSKIDKGAYAEYEAVIGTSDKDMDGDIVEPYGYDFDMKSPALWMHAHGMPVGSLKSIVSQDEKQATCRFKVADTALGRDAVALMQVGALRKSIGFKPVEFTPLGFKKDAKTGQDVPDGWHVKKSKILENSLVSVPANLKTGVNAVYGKAIDGILTLSGQKKFQDERIALWAKSFDEGRPSAVRGWTKPEAETAVEAIATEFAASATKQMDASEMLTKFYGVDGYMPNCFEDRIGKVQEAFQKYVKVNELGGGDCYCYTIATYAEMAIGVCCEYSGGKRERKMFQCEYAVGDGGMIAIAKATEIDIQPSIVPVGSTPAAEATMGSSITMKLEAVEKRLGHFATKSNDGTKIEPVVVEAVVDGKSTIRKAIAGLMIDGGHDIELASDLRKAAEAFERLHSVQQLRDLGLVN